MGINDTKAKGNRRSTYQHEAGLRAISAVRASLLRILCLMPIILLCSCARTVSVTHSELEPKQGFGDIFATKVVVQSLPSTEKDTFTRTGFFAVGIHNSWAIDFASSVPEAVADALSLNFNDVVVEQDYRRGCNGCGMIVRPRVKRFGLNKLTLQSTIELEILVYDAYENHVATFSNTGKSAILSLDRAGVIAAGYFIPMAGSTLGKPIVRATVRKSLDEALENLADTFLRESEVGGQLARVWRPKKQEYGTHEYAAELVARRLGCDMKSDGITLVSEHYGKEVYDAYCWERGRFTIICELGRCTENVNPLRPVASQARMHDGEI